MSIRLPSAALLVLLALSMATAAANIQLGQLEQRLASEPAQISQELGRLLPLLEQPQDRHRALLLKARAERDLKQFETSITTLEQLLDDQPQTLERARALLLKAEITGLKLHQRRAAIPILEQALVAVRSQPPGDRQLEREIMETMGKAQLHIGETEVALRFFLDAQRLLTAQDNPELHAWNLIYQAQAHTVLARYDQAENLYLKALAKVERNQFPNLDAQIYARLATLLKEQRSYDKALQYADKALELYTSLNDSFNIMRTFNRIGAIHADQGDYENALVHYLNALDISPESRLDPAMGAILLYNIGEAYVQLGQYSNGKPYLDKALSTFERGEQRAYLPPVILQLATIAEAAEQADEAVALGLRARDLAEQYSSLEQRLEAHDKLAAILARAGRFEEAWQSQLKAQQLVGERQFKPLPARVDTTGMVEREQLVKQLDDQRAELNRRQQQQQYHELTLQLLALFTLCVLWLLYHRWRRDWRLRRTLVHYRRLARHHPTTGLPNLASAKDHLDGQLQQLQQRYERWYGEERGSIPRDTLRCALIALPNLEHWHHCDGLLATTERQLAFGQQLQRQAEAAGWQLFSLRDGLILATAARQREGQEQLDKDARALISVINSVDASQLCALALSDFPFTPRVSRAVDSDRLQQVLQTALLGSRQLMSMKGQSAWLTLQPQDTLPSTLLASDTGTGTLLAIRNGMIRISASHERHRIRWPTTCETLAPVMGESHSSRYTEASLGQY
ncbi:MAG: tetratricopeptide repeat protein [Gammaproteobacteria bacterium]|nr:tetratricopeptide repeat protein [Gammaproteobacteria bacterium]